MKGVLVADALGAAIHDVPYAFQHGDAAAAARALER